ncbi:kynureninase [Chloroflexota bacterium]
MNTPTNRQHALSLDQQDPLAGFRQRFVIDDPDLIYLDGNSLGRLPKAAVELARTLVEEQWGQGLIRSWGRGWLYNPEHLGEKLAQLLGAQPGEVIVADPTSINLFKLVVGALRHQTGRTKIVTDNLNFPSDIYILQGAADLLAAGHRIEIIPSPDSIHGPVEALIDSLDQDTALLTLSHTTFKSGYTYDIAELTAAAKERGVLTLWDLSHSAGAVPIDLNATGADLAVGCTYKYLNGGPGAPAYLYVRQDLLGQIANPITGWMGRVKMFDFELDYQPDPTLRQLLTSSPPVLSMALIEPGIDLLIEAGMDRLREKSVAQTEYMLTLWRARLEPLGFTLNSPLDPAYRGSHISIGHQHGLGIDLALIEEMNVIPDFRAPDNIRLGFAPLYTTFTEIFDAVSRIEQIVVEKRYEKYQHQAPTVT